MLGLRISTVHKGLIGVLSSGMKDPCLSYWSPAGVSRRDAVTAYPATLSIGISGAARWLNAVPMWPALAQNRAGIGIRSGCYVATRRSRSMRIWDGRRLPHRGRVGAVWIAGRSDCSIDPSHRIYPRQLLPSKHETFAQCCFNVGPAFPTLAQHWNSIGRMPRVCWVASPIPPFPYPAPWSPGTSP